VKIPEIIDKSFFEENKANIDWKGKGTQNEPFVIDDRIDLPLNIRFMTGDLYIHIRNIDINILVLENCQNIIVEDSILSKIKILKCNNVIIRENLIRDMKIFFGRDNIIEKNRIYSILNMRSFTLLALIIALFSGLLIVLSYVEGFYIFRYIGVFLLFIGVITVLFEITEKRDTRFLTYKLKNNDFIKLADGSDRVTSELDNSKSSKNKINTNNFN
jgi:hypothetical protein